MDHDMPTTVEWLDGTTRNYAGYDAEISAGMLTLTRHEARPVVIPLANVRELTVGGILLVSA